MSSSIEANALASATGQQPAAESRPLQRPALLLGPLFALSALVPLPAHAVDGCVVLMCFAAPSWSSIAQCVSPVQQVLSDLAHGHPFPSCSMAGAGNSARVRASDPPTYCPPQYTRIDYLESGSRYTCDYDAAVEVQINGVLWARTWWNQTGASVTEFTSSAKAQLGTWDSRFDDDYTAWQASSVPAAPDSGRAGS